MPRPTRRRGKGGLRHVGAGPACTASADVRQSPKKADHGAGAGRDIARTKCPPPPLPTTARPALPGATTVPQLPSARRRDTYPLRCARWAHAVGGELCEGAAAAAASGAVFLASVALRANCVGGELVFDDHVAVTLNRDVTGAAPLAGLLQNDFWGTPAHSNASHKSYRPLSVLAMRGVHAACGPQAPCFRATNVFVHHTSRT
eukprot:gene18171-51993_t